MLFRSYDKIDQGDTLKLENLLAVVGKGAKATLVNETKNETYELEYEFSDRQEQILLDGGLLGYTKNQNN